MKQTAPSPWARPLWALCWLGLLGYGVGLVLHARAEVTERFEVRIGDRTYRYPYTDPDGEVLDPRRGALNEEICARYAPHPTCALASLEPEALAAVGLSAEAASGFGDGTPPHLVPYLDRTVLVVAEWQDRPVIFDPARGVVLLRPDAASPEAGVALLGARRSPW